MVREEDSEICDNVWTMPKVTGQAPGWGAQKPYVEPTGGDCSLLFGGPDRCEAPLLIQMGVGVKLSMCGWQLSPVLECILGRFDRCCWAGEGEDHPPCTAPQFSSVASEETDSTWRLTVACREGNKGTPPL